jgi:hypothetical protein
MCLPEFLNPTSSFIAVRKLTVLDCIFSYAHLDPHCLRKEGAVVVHLPTHCSHPLSHFAKALLSGFSCKLPGYKYIYLTVLIEITLSGPLVTTIWYILSLQLEKAFKYGGYL